MLARRAWTVSYTVPNRVIKVLVWTMVEGDFYAVRPLPKQWLLDF